MSARREYAEIEELNRILTVERELVLKTQENYRTLKEKFLHLSKENESLKKERAKLLEGSESREKLLELEARSDELIRVMREANEEREVRYEKFKVETIEELQNVYRKELQDQSGRIEKLRADRVELVGENDQLLEEIANLNANLDDLKRREKAKEVEIRTKFDKKLKEIMMRNEQNVSPRFDYYEQTIESLRGEIQKKEEMILEKSKLFSTQISQKNAEIESFKREEDSLKTRIIELETTIQNQKMETSRASSESELRLEIESLVSKNQILLDERMNLESKMRQSQRDSSRKLNEIEEKFAIRIAEFEKICEQKQTEIDDLRVEFEKASKFREELEKSERDRQIEEEQRERLETEVRNLYERLQKADDERLSSEASLKTERDRLEVSLVTLKKQLESTPEAPQNVEKLRRELRDSEKKRLSDKEKHRKSIAELDSALKIMEKRYRQFQEKYRENLAANLNLM